MRLGQLDNLSDHIVLRGLLQLPKATVNSRQCMGFGGKRILEIREVSDDGPLELQGENHFSYGELKSIYDMIGQTVELDHHQYQGDVVVISIDPEPAFEYADQEDDDWFSAIIHIEKVS